MTPGHLTSPTRAVDSLTPELLGIRRDLHRHPELSREEHRTTALVLERLQGAGIAARAVDPTGVIADIGADEAPFRVALRADLDALPVRERTGLDWASVRPDVTHACGHDFHTGALLGAGLALHAMREELDEAGLAVRMLFQPAEEAIPGGALDLIDAGGLDRVHAAYAVHCDPSLDVGKVGLREGPLTAAADRLIVKLTGRGGHTSRPHLTEDLTFALAKVITEVPTLLSRRVDPRAGLVLVWGTVHAGRTSNVIPSSGEAQGTLRILDADVWRGIGPLLREIVEDVIRPYGVQAEIVHTQGVPPVVNVADAVDDLRAAAQAVGLGVVPTSQSMGGEDFAWFLHRVPGAMARLGTRTIGGRTYDLHQGDLVVDEAALGHGARLLAAVALAALERNGGGTSRLRNG